MLRLLDDGRPARRASARLSLEPLEDRTTPSRLLWAGPSGGAWGDAANWLDLDTNQPAEAAPGEFDDVVIDGSAHNTSSVTTGVSAIHSLRVERFTQTITVVGDLNPTTVDLTISGPVLLGLGDPELGAEGMLVGDTGGPVLPTVHVTGEGSGVTWTRGIIALTELWLGMDAVSLMQHGGGAVGSNRLTLSGTHIINEGYMEVRDSVIQIFSNVIDNIGHWKLNGNVYAWIDNDANTFINHVRPPMRLPGMSADTGLFEVQGPNYWYFDVRNMGAAEFGYSLAGVGYPGILLTTDFDQGDGDPETIIMPFPYTRLVGGSELYVGKLSEQTFDVEEGLLIMDGTVSGSVHVLGLGTLVAGTYDFGTGLIGLGHGVVHVGSILIEGTLSITVTESGTASTLFTENTITLADAHLVVQNHATPPEGTVIDFMTALDILGDFDDSEFPETVIIPPFWRDQGSPPGVFDLYYAAELVPTQGIDTFRLVVHRLT
jgi:hypothetical protein